MQQQISVITLGIADIARSKRFYAEGFGWKPVWQNDEIAFYQMNGLVLGTWLRAALEADVQRAAGPGPGAFALARSFDPLFLARLGLRQAKPDKAQALAWYEKAASAGHADAAAAIVRLKLKR